MTELKGFAAGFMVGIGGIVYLSCENHYIGALLFSVALLIICMSNMNLYTGKVGFIVENATGVKFRGWVDRSLSLVKILILNTSGVIWCALFALLHNRNLRILAIDLCTAKLDKSIMSVLYGAIFCGMLMHAAVWIYKKKSSCLGIIFCIPVFILSGFEHCIADMFYFLMANIISWRGVWFILVAIIGNAIGGILMSLAVKEKGD